jgi:hypothetical protein
MSAEPLRILVVDNETVGGRALIDAVRKRAEAAHAEGRPIEVMVVAPQNQPKHGYVVYDESVRSAAESRLRTTVEQLRAAGIEASAEVMDPDPYNATMDALGAFKADELVISTHPDLRSGWLRRDLIDRVKDASGLPVEHVVVDLDADRAERVRTLVVANKTAAGEPLVGLLRGKAQESPHSFVVIMPQGGSEAGDAPERLARVLDRLHSEGLEATGQVMPPDPFTAIQNALQFFAVDEIVISTFPGERSGWLRNDLIARVQGTTSKPVEHVVVKPSEAREGAAA